MRCALILLLIAAASPLSRTQSPPAPPSSSADVARLVTFYERQVIESEKKHNWEAIFRRLAPDFVELSPDGRFFTREQAEEVFRKVQLLSYRLADVQVRVLSPTSAFIGYRISVDATFEGRPSPGTYLAGSTWAKVNGAWLMKTHQVTVVPK